MKNWPDWAVRAAKTFVQAFLGVMIPAIVALLKDGLPQDWGAVGITLVSAMMAALAAGIAAVWNIALETRDMYNNCGGGGKK